MSYRSEWAPIPEIPSDALKPVKTKKPKPPVKATFEEAMQWLRRGLQVRRRSWHFGSTIFALGTDVYVRLPGNEKTDTVGTNYRRAPDIWRPYPSDFLADDWMKA